MAKKIRVNDDVVVLTGKYKNVHSTVIALNYAKNVAWVKSVNMVKKHQKPIPAKNQVGGIIRKESPIHISNLAILNNETGKADRIGFRIENGKKVRFLKSNKKILK